MSKRNFSESFSKESKNTRATGLMTKEKEKEILQRIAKIQKELEELTLAMTGKESVGERDEEERILKIGDQVEITNSLKPFQEKQGEIVKINKDTGFVWVKGRRTKREVRRKEKNVRRIKQYD